MIMCGRCKKRYPDEVIEKLNIQYCTECGDTDWCFPDDVEDYNEGGYYDDED